MRPKQSAFVRFLLGLLSFLLCVVLFVSTIVTIVIADVRLLTNGDMLQKLISQTLLTSISGGKSGQVPMGAATPLLMSGSFSLEGMDFSQFLPGGYLPASESELTKFVYDTLTEHFGEEIPVSYDQINDFIERSTVTDFLSEKVAAIATDIFTGEGNTKITVEEIEKLLTENQPLIQECLGVELKDEHIQQVVEQIEESEVLEQLDSEKLREEIGLGGESVSMLEGGAPTLPNILATVNAVTSMTVLMSAIGVCLGLVLLLFLCNLRRVHSAMISSGVTFMLASFLFVLVNGSAYVLPGLFRSMGLIGNTIQSVLKLTGWVSFGVFGGGLLLVILGCVVKSASRRRAVYVAAVPVGEPVAVPVVVAAEPVGYTTLEAEVPTAEDESFAPQPEEKVEEPQPEEKAEEPQPEAPETEVTEQPEPQPEQPETAETVTQEEK